MYAIGNILIVAGFILSLGGIAAGGGWIATVCAIVCGLIMAHRFAVFVSKE